MEPPVAASQPLIWDRVTGRTAGTTPGCLAHTDAKPSGVRSPPMWVAPTQIPTAQLLSLTRPSRRGTRAHVLPWDGDSSLLTSVALPDCCLYLLSASSAHRVCECRNRPKNSWAPSACARSNSNALALLGPDVGRHGLQAAWCALSRVACSAGWALPSRLLLCPKLATTRASRPAPGSSEARHCDASLPTSRRRGFSSSVSALRKACCLQSQHPLPKNQGMFPKTRLATRHWSNADQERPQHDPPGDTVCGHGTRHRER